MRTDGELKTYFCILNYKFTQNLYRHIEIKCLYLCMAVCVCVRVCVQQNTY